MSDVPLRCLIIEDEPLIAMVLEDMLESIGHDVVGVVNSLDSAGMAIDEGDFDVVILDVNLGTDPAWDIADALQERGRAFILATGSPKAAAPERFRDAHFLSKPYLLADVDAVMKRLFAR